jgi:lipid-binding SYLF domain-containing protein
LSKAVGLAIFTTARVGFEVSLATGSGILIARLPDGAWGPPSAIQVHTLGAGFLVGLDIYDCVCVINTKEALSAFTKTRVALGTEVSVAAGPFGAGGKLDVGTGAGHPRRQDDPPLPPSEKPSHTAVSAGETYPGQHATGPPVDSSKLSAEPHRPKTHHRRSSSKALGPVFTYVKSRGFFAGVHVDGTVITERKEANHAFYGARLPAEQILRGEGIVNQQGPKLWPGGARVLLDALKQAERERPREEVLVPPTVATPAIAQPPPRVEPVGAQVQAQRETQGKEGAVPVYVQPADDGPPPYVEDGTAHPGVGDQKLPPPQ